MTDSYEKRYVEFLKLIEIGDEKYIEDIAKFAFDRSEEYIKAFCNIRELPRELFGVHKAVAIDFFHALENSIENKGHIKSLREGLVTMEFFEREFGRNEYLYVVEKYMCELIPFRKLRW